MKTIKFVGYLFYRYYSKAPNRGIPHFRTITSLTMLGFMNIFAIAILFGKGDFISKAIDYFKLDKRIIILLMFIPIFCMMALLFKQRDIAELEKKYESDDRKISSGKTWLITYCITSFALIFVLAFWNRAYS